MNLAVEAIVDELGRVPRFADVEIVKRAQRHERGTLVVTVVVDHRDGVGTQLLEELSKWLVRRIDALPPPAFPYQLELASVGLERPLSTAAEFARFHGRRVKVITKLHIGRRTEFEGEIAAADEVAVRIADPHAGPTDIPYAAIKRAHLVYDPRADLQRRKRR